MLNKLGMKSKEKMTVNNLKNLNVAFKEIEIDHLQEKVIGGVYVIRKNGFKITRW